MKIKPIGTSFSICKVKDYSGVDLNRPYCFLGRTDEECSLVCPTQDVPAHAIAREDGWKAFRIEGVLDFSLIGVLAKITALLAEQQIPVFALSTYNTDYFLTKQAQYEKALAVLSHAGYEIL